ncbi:MAG: type I pullulanase [Clostridiales bacterium]|nr:type I pullulanase [Clostridiales bacterium]
MLRINDYAAFDRDNYYGGDDLGVKIVDGKTQFRTWSPWATGVYLKVFADGTGMNLVESLPMERHWTGVWFVEILRSLDGYFYTFSFEFHGRREETIDIYAKACGVNGDRGAIVDFSTTNPKGWDKVKSPICESPCDAIIYETHVRDFSIDPTSGVSLENRGKYLGFTEEKTRNGEIKTGLDHLIELGVTHVQLLPVGDFVTVDESKPHKAQYNWGYDPKNYNCLEGSYSTDPEDPKKRITEFKELVMALHKKGIGVIMDVVYNHTYYTELSAFHKSFPYYYHRNRDGLFSNGSGCGNETASEHLMMRKFIIDSIKFWATEYKIDGFRFDLMALHDIETVNLIRGELNKINPNILMYGEGWTGGDSLLSVDQLAFKWNSYKFGAVGLFNDNIRDAIKGGTFNAYEAGYVSGDFNAAGVIKRGIVGSVPHSQLDTHQDACWAYEPTQSINYCEAHDNNTLWDKICISANHQEENIRKRMDMLAAAILMVSQGVPFIQFGQDFLRTKPKILPVGTEPNPCNIFDENSYNAPDFTNSIKWGRKAEYFDVFRYYKALIKLRKSSKLFRLSTKEDVERCLRFEYHDDPNLICFSLRDEDECFYIIINPTQEFREVWVPEYIWNEGMCTICCDESGKAFREPINKRNIIVTPISMVAVKRVLN